VCWLVLACVCGFWLLACVGFSTQHSTFNI
jgi:hypothetical protein